MKIRNSRWSLMTAIIGLVIVSGSAVAQNNDCWLDGYQKGYCDGKGAPANMCLAPIPPLPPLPPLGRDDCKSRFVDGYRAGLAAGAASK